MLSSFVVIQTVMYAIYAFKKPNRICKYIWQSYRIAYDVFITC